MRMTEAMAKEIFGEHLRREGWQVEFTSADFVDIRATRGDETLIAEVKGHTKSAGAALDIGYGQLLRRINSGRPHHRYALVVPDTLRWHAERVLPETRQRVRIELFVITEDGEVVGV